MATFGHSFNERGESEFRVFAPLHASVAVVLLPEGRRVPLTPDPLGYWHGATERLPEGSRYLIEIDGARFPDVASRRQPEGVHGPSAVAAPSTPSSPGWAGVRMEDAIVYELHLGTFTPEGTLAAATGRLDHLAALGITVVELLPLATFPGQRNWGYDGTYLFALQADYGDYDDLRRFIERAHALGMAVLLDVVYNHFGPEGNYAAAYAPFTKAAPTPWGDAINFDADYNHGIRAFFLENLRYWIEDAGFDGVRMDAVAAIFDNMPVHILREFTELGHAIGRRQGRQVLMIAEHLRNDRNVTSRTGFGFDAQWNDDLNHAVYACLTGESDRHYANFGSFGDVVRALVQGFVLDGTRFDRYRRFLTGTDGAGTQGSEHVVHVQNHDQVGNRAHGDRLIASHGRAKALLAVTTMLASPFVPMLFMGEEYGETAPFLFFEDFGDAALVEAVRRGRHRDLELPDGVEPPDPHARSTFVASKLRWPSVDTPEASSVLDYYRRLIAMKRSGALGPRDRSAVRVVGDEATRVIRIETSRTLTVLNFSDVPRDPAPGAGWTLALSSMPLATPGLVAPYGAAVYQRP